MSSAGKVDLRNPEPQSVVESLFRKQGAADLIRFSESRCLALRSRFGACRLCVTACPVGALNFAESSLEVSRHCTGCGRCAAACPTGALAVAGFDFDSNAIPVGSASFVDCGRAPLDRSPQGTIHVPCLGGLSPARLVELKAKAGRADVTLLDRGWCQACPAGDRARHPASEPLRTARYWLREVGLGDSEMPRIERRPLHPDLQQELELSAVNRQPMSRRRFLRALVGSEAAPVRPQTGATDHYNAGIRQQIAEPITAPERNRLLEGLRAIAARTGHALPQSLFAALVISDSCGNHQICAKLCPTGALRPYSEAGSGGVVFDSTACISCGDCERACPQQAVRLMPGQGAHTGQSIRLTRWQLQSCAECEHEFTGSVGEQVCPECRKTRDVGRSLFNRHGNPAHSAGTAPSGRPLDGAVKADFS